MSEFFTTVVTSALVATIAGAAINEWLDSRKRKHAVRFDALSAAISLEGYAITCADRIADDRLAKDSSGHAGQILGSIPELPKISVVAGFIQPRKAEIANRLMTFSQEARQAEQVVAFIWDVTADPEQVHEAAVAEAANLGVSALNLADDLRQSFRLPKRDLRFGKFDVRDSLNKAQKQHAGSD